MTSIGYSIISSIGGTISVNIEQGPTEHILLAATSPVVLAANVAINFTGTPSEGSSIVISWGGDFDLDGNTFTINGVSLSDTQALNKGYLSFLYHDSAWMFFYAPDLSKADALDGTVIASGTLPLASLEDMDAGKVLLGNASKIPTATAITGDMSINSSGYTTLGSGVVTNAKVASGAAIARTKLASGTASYILANDGSGVMGEQQFVSKAQGGFGASVAAATGFTKFSGGTLNISSIVDSRDYIVSFETDDLNANNTYTLGFDCTLVPTNCSGFVIRELAGVSDGVITLKKNGVAISSGTITFAAGALQNDAGVFGSFAATNFTAGDTISLVATKGHAGGMVNVTLQFTRNS